MTNKIILAFLGILFLLIAGFLKFVKDVWNLTLFLFVSSEEIITITLILGGICLGTLLLSIFSSLKRNAKKYSFLYTIVSSITLFCLTIFIIICLIGLVFIFDSGKYYVFQSPGKKHTIVVEERSFLLAGSGTFYVKENALFMKEVDGYFTDDGYRPFQLNDFQLKWEKDSVSIIYGFGSQGIQKQVNIPFSESDDQVSDESSLLGGFSFKTSHSPNQVHTIDFQEVVTNYGVFFRIYYGEYASILEKYKEFNGFDLSNIDLFDVNWQDDNVVLIDVYRKAEDGTRFKDETIRLDTSI